MPGHTAGNEIDFTVDCALRKGLSMRCGLDLFLPDKAWQGTDAEAACFSYISITGIF